MKIILLLSVFVGLILTLPHQTPIIGIYTQSDTGDEPRIAPSGETLETGSHSYIAASYVKFIQMSGAQVVPLFAYSNQSYFDEILPKINGVLFPGIFLLIQEERKT